MLNRIRYGLADRFSRLKRNASPADIACIIMILVSFVISLFIVKDIFTYEFHHAYTADAPLYWAVGRGMLNGNTPYSGMYENKPPGIFLISALSFWLTGSSIICNVMSCLAALMLTFLPAWILFDEFKRTDKKDTGSVRKTAVLLTVILSGLLITVYSEVRSGGFQVEAIGSAFSVLFICLVIKLKNAGTRRQRLILTVCAALAISCAVMIKEPFLIVSVFGALLFVDGIKNFFKNIVLPCALGGVLTLAVLAVSGVLVPYFSIYIKRMFETRLSGESSAFTRALNLLKLTDDVKGFSEWLFYLLLFFIVLTLLRILLKKRSEARILIHVLKVVAAILAASFCVGMGGQYYNHHYIFAVPVYCSFVICSGEMLYEFKPKKAAASGSVILLWGMILLMVIPNIGNKYAGDYTGKYQSITVKADYVDSLLDYYGEERYQYIGFNGEDVFIGLTEHSPLGPVFAQDSDNFSSADTWFSKSLIEQLNESNIVIVKEYKSPAIDSTIKEMLEKDFTLNPAQTFSQNPPYGFGCSIYYRISKYG